MKNLFFEKSGVFEKTSKVKFFVNINKLRTKNQTIFSRNDIVIRYSIPISLLTYDKNKGVYFSETLTFNDIENHIYFSSIK
jgi:hypothetical protein